MIEFKRILVPLDGSRLSERALPLAMALAKKFESLIILLGALDNSEPIAPSLAPSVSARMNEYQELGYEEAEDYLEAREDEIFQQGFRVRTALSSVELADSIIDTAATEDVDLIVMSTHGHRGLARWAYGSVADKVTRNSLCPVLVVR